MGSRPRLTMLVSTATWRREPISEQLPALLGPLGIRCVGAASGDEAQDVIRSATVHIAVVDFAIPLHSGGSVEAPEAGPRLLQLLRRLDSPPPTIVIRPPQPSLRDSGRSLSAALHEGAFAVLDRPIHLEALLEALRRIVRRHYRDHWPA